ncbi:helix-turn-helix domain-containing protein [Citrobacter meridianamericanus]|uniref:helix-turn-helix domain-containing protein n=1 Tax=Citrobacter meridianamericanus TaxID=2894201 RepID=UPI00351D1C19
MFFEVHHVERKITYTQREEKTNPKKIAAELGITTQTLQTWERGESEPKASQLVILSKLFGVSIEEICTGNETSADQRLSLKISEAEKLNPEEKNCIETLLEAMLIRHYVREVKITE